MYLCDFAELCSFMLRISSRFRRRKFVVPIEFDENARHDEQQRNVPPAQFHERSTRKMGSEVRHNLPDDSDGDVDAVACEIAIGLERRVFGDHLVADRAPKAPGPSRFVEMLEDRGVLWRRSETCRAGSQRARARSDTGITIERVGLDDRGELRTKRFAVRFVAPARARSSRPGCRPSCPRSNRSR